MRIPKDAAYVVFQQKAGAGHPPSLIFRVYARDKAPKRLVGWTIWNTLTPEAFEQMDKPADYPASLRADGYFVIDYNEDLTVTAAGKFVFNK